MKIRGFMFVSFTLPLLVAEDSALHIAKRSSKPLQDICFDRAETLNWRISYEEPPALSEDELVPDIVPRSGVHRLVMRAAPVVVDIRTKNGDPGATKNAAMEAILDAYHRAGNRGVFQAIEAGDFIHVVP